MAIGSASSRRMRQARRQRRQRILEDHLHAPPEPQPVGARERRSGRGPRRGPCPDVGRFRPTSALASVVLPLPLSPTSPTVSPGGERQADAGDRLHAAGEGDGQVSRPRSCRSTSCQAPASRLRAWPGATASSGGSSTHFSKRDGQRARKDAAGRHVDQVGQPALDRHQARRPARRRGRSRRRAAPACRDGAGRRTGLRGRAALDDLAGIHHRDVVAEFGDQAEAVRDEDDRAVELGCRRLQQARRSAPRSSRRAPSSARRRSAGRARRAAPWRSSRAGACRPKAGADRRRAACSGSEMPTAPASPAARRSSAVRPRSGWRLRCASTSCVPMREHRVERRHRILEDHGDARAAQPCAAPRRRAPAGLRHRTRCGPNAGRYLPGSSPSSASASVDLPLPLSPTRPTMRRRPIDRSTSRRACSAPFAVAKSTRQVLDRDQRRFAHGSRLSLGSMASRSASPNSVKPSVASVSMPPGDQHRPDRLLEIGEAVEEHRAPARQRRADADAEEAQAGLERDDDRDVHAGQHDDRADDVGQHVEEHDARARCAERPLGLEEGPLP